MTVSAPAGEARGGRPARGWSHLLLPLVGVVLTLLAWQAWSMSRGGESILAAFSPRESARSLWQLLTTGALLPHIVVSVKRVMVGLLIGTLLGVPLGILLGTQGWFERTTAPVLHLLRMISPLSWMPIAIMVFGIGDAPVYFLLGIATLFPMMLHTRAAMAQVDRKWLLAIRSLGANRWEQLRYVHLPAILIQVLTGFRLAVGLAWIVLVPAEMLGVTAGLGYYILDTRDRLAYSEMMAVILVIGLLGYTLDSLARLLVSRWTPHLRS